MRYNLIVFQQVDYDPTVNIYNNHKHQIGIIMSKKPKATAISLPPSRTNKIMISAVGVESVNPDIVALATKATEIFLMDFARRAYDQASEEEFRSNTLEYEDIQRLVHTDPRYDFLIDTIPKRIKFSEAMKLVEEANRRQQEQEEAARAAAAAKAAKAAEAAAAAAAASKAAASPEQQDSN